MNDISAAAIEATSSLTPSKSPLVAQSLIRAGKLALRQERLFKRIKLFEERLRLSQNFRLGTALAFIVGLLILAIRPDFRLELPLLGGFLVLFSTLVVRTRRIDKHLRALRGLRIFFDRQERRLRGLPSARPWEGSQKASEHLPLIRDLGLMGSHSLWTLIDETLTEGGQTRLLEWIANQRQINTEEILRRQRQIQNLRSEAWFFTRLSVQGSADDFRLSSGQILLFLKKPFVKDRFLILFALAWLSWFAALAAFVIFAQKGTAAPGWPLAVFAAINLALLNSVGTQFKKGIGLSHHLDLLAPIFGILEARLPKSERLQALAPVTKASGPSREARKLNRVLAFMSVESNPLVFLLVNALSPWSITATHFLERRRRKIAYAFPQCLEELAELEALASLVIFDHYQTNRYPTLQLSHRHPSLTAEGIFHPLIERERVVPNDFGFPSGKRLGLLTGSNMSGKSTFLRTIGLNQILANMGAPIFAESLITLPFGVETCIEVSDSLRDGFSYFYSEVRRLKKLLEAAKSPTEPTLFLVDEIFRGTNNRERHIGSRAVIRTLADSQQALGFISTHDLELTGAEAAHDSVLNLHFREEFSNEGQMVFSYLIHRGPCPTTNALKIMAAEGIDVELA
jgi:ABC-type multidrug transport system fused ATPase/permease subunit